MNAPRTTPHEPLVDVVTTQHDDALVLHVSGDIDLASAPTLSRAIVTALDDRPPTLVFDLTRVRFLASVGLSLLIEAQSSAHPATHVVVVADGPVTARPITITGVDEIVPLYATLGEALTAASR